MCVSLILLHEYSKCEIHCLSLSLTNILPSSTTTCSFPVLKHTQNVQLLSGKLHLTQDNSFTIDIKCGHVYDGNCCHDILQVLSLL